MELIPHFQPIVCHSSAEIIGYEATIKGLDTDGKQYGAVQLFAKAEYEGKVVELDGAARSISFLYGKGLLRDKQRLFLNISAESLQDDTRWFDQDAPIHLVTLEITEQAPIRLSPTLLKRITGLRKKGMKVAIDDYGVGYNSLYIVDAFRPDYLKLDKLITQDSSDKTIRSMVSFCRESNITLIAEGIESKEQLVRLKCLGINHFQGYLFGHPVPYRVNGEEIRACY